MKYLLKTINKNIPCHTYFVCHTKLTFEVPMTILEENFPSQNEIQMEFYLGILQDVASENRNQQRR